MHLRCFVLSFLVSLPSFADDGAASIAAGGLVLMRREPRIVMAKEVLRISDTKVIVDYDFRNDSDQDITTEVAFPIPAYGYDPNAWASPQHMGFDDFRLTVNGSSRPFTTQIRAMVGTRDITDELRSLKIDPATFRGLVRWTDREPEILDLPANMKRHLVGIGAVGAVWDDGPAWKVEKKYHWAQTFPAKGTVHIRHEYTPVPGNSSTIGDASLVSGRPEGDEYASVCPDPGLRAALRAVPSAEREPIGIFYVDFVLTTANTWRRPIEDFTLIVDKPNGADRRANFVSFCWDGPVSRDDKGRFIAHAKDLVPRRELRVGFIQSDFTNAQLKRFGIDSAARPD